MATIGIITCNFGRVPILEIFCAGIERLRRDTGLAIPTVCVGDEDGAELCSENGIYHEVYPNKPLTGKFNRAMYIIRNRYDVDYVMIMGSDNLLSTRTFLAIKEECDKGTDLVGLSEVYFFCCDDVHTGKLIHFRHTTVLGVGRTISRRVLDAVGWQPWNIERDRAIDTIMLDSVRPYVKTRALLDGYHVFDLKTSFNLNNVNFWSRKLGYMPDAKLFWDNIGTEETKLVEQYLNK